MRAAWLALLTLPVQAAADPTPACLASVRIEPRQAVVGQQLTQHIEILRRDDVERVSWDPPPQFPGLRAHRLVAAFSMERRQLHGASYLVREERHALFPLRHGRLNLPAARLHCEVGGAIEAVELERGVLQVEPNPLAARGTPLVGRFEMDVHAEPDNIALGESLQLRVTVSGPVNLWDLELPARQLGLAEHVEVIAHAPSLELEAGRRLQVRRDFIFDLIPRRVGGLGGNWLTIPYLEVGSGDARVRARIPELQVVKADGPAPQSPAPIPAEADRTRTMPWFVLICVGALVGAVAFARRRQTKS